MTHWKTLTLTVSSDFQSEQSESWSTSKVIQDYEASSGKTFGFENFYVTINDMDRQSIKGSCNYSYETLTLDGGEFSLNHENLSYKTAQLDVAPNTLSSLEVSISFDESPYQRIQVVLSDVIDKDASAMPPATDEDIDRCNTELVKYKLPVMPPDFISFLKLCSALQYKDLSIFGSYGCQIVEQNMMLRKFYTNYHGSENLLIIGRIDDDIYTYNAADGNYEARDMKSFRIWDVYKSFDAFFFAELMKWLH